jgi:hypothetical protein
MLEDIEEKVRTQHSAGADVANARRIDRPFGEKALDETDKEAARTLRTGGKAARAGRKPKTKKGKPLSEQAWLKALPLVAVLGAIGGLLWYTFKPATRDGLYADWKRAGTADGRVAAAEKYLARFGGDADERTKEVRGSLREAKGEQLRTMLDKRFNRSFAGRRISTAQDNEDPEAYAAAWAAMEAEEKGDLAQAAGFWKKILARGADITDEYGAGWQWVAERHIADINAIDGKLGEAKAEVAQSQVKELPWNFDPTLPDALAKLAVRYDSDRHLKAATGIVSNRPQLPLVKDPAKTRKAWASLAELTKGKSDQHVWHLLAGREVQNYPDVKGEQVVAERVKMLTGLLAAVEQEWARVGASADLLAEQRDCRNRCRDVVELYRDEPEPLVKKLVEAAEALLKKMQAKS